MWIYIIVWTLIFDASMYGKLQENFEKKFASKKQANEFIKKAPKCCIEIMLDSIWVDTSTVEAKHLNVDSLFLRNYTSPKIYNSIDLLYK